jgi:hypothetical protein
VWDLLVSSCAAAVPKQGIALRRRTDPWRRSGGSLDHYSGRPFRVGVCGDAEGQ